MLIKLKFHSVVDLITNSSTTIFTYEDSCPRAINTLIEELGKALGFNMTASDMFHIAVFCDNDDEYHEFIDNMDDEDLAEYPDLVSHIDDNTLDKFITETINGVLTGKITRPGWMKDAEHKENWSGFCPPTSVNILAKDPKFESIGTALQKLISSPSHEAFRDG